MDYPKGIEAYLKKWKHDGYNRSCPESRREIIKRAAADKTPENLLAASKTFGKGPFACSCAG